MRSKLTIRDRRPIGLRRGVDRGGNVPPRTQHLPPASEQDLGRAAHEYRRVHEVHRHARAGRARRKLELRLVRLRRRFERLLEEAAISGSSRRRWRGALRPETPVAAAARGPRAVLFGGRPARRSPAAAPVPEIVVRGRVARRTRDELTTMLLDVAEVAPAPVLHIRGSVVRGEDPALDRPVVAAAQLELASRTVRAHVAAASERAAIDLLQARLRRNVRKHADRVVAERRKAPRRPVA